MHGFRCGRDFAAWLGLVPTQGSTGGRSKLGPTSRMGQRDIRRLLILGAKSQIRWAIRNGAAAGDWQARILARKPRLLVATALANRMARTIWAMTTRQQDYRPPATTTVAWGSGVL